MIKHFVFLYSLLFIHIPLFLSGTPLIDSLVYRSILTSKVLPQERVYLHFDNSGYYLGESIHFKAYVVCGNGVSIPSPSLSQVLYVELCAPEGYVVESKKYKLDSRGCCSGSFDLLPSFLSGYYEIRAYTRYMLNWGDDVIFSRVFPIFDKVNGDNYDFLNILSRPRGFLYRGEWISNESEIPTLSFFPEGGHLLQGVKNKLVYEVRDKHGKPLNDSVYIFYGKDSLVSESVPIHLGKGYFTFTPEVSKSKKYTVLLRHSGKVYKYRLPEIRKSGSILSLSQNSDTLLFKVLSNDSSESDSLGFVILHRNRIIYYTKISCNLSLLSASLPEGVNRAILLRSDGIPLSERMFFVNHSEKQDGDLLHVPLESQVNGFSVDEKNSFPPYHKLTVRLRRTDGSPLPRDGSYSVSVVCDANRLSTNYCHDLYTQMLLASEIKGYIPDITQYFDINNQLRHRNLDLLMLTNGWTSYDWNMLAGLDSFSVKHPVEKGLQVKGRFLKKEKVRKLGKMGTFKLTPQSGVSVRFDISYSDSIISNYEFTTEAGGNFLLTVNDFYGKKYASLTPSLNAKQIQDSIYCFSLDKYFSPRFRLYDYWERNVSRSVENKSSLSSIYLDEINLLDELDVIAEREHIRCSRPPRSELRLDFMEEWEYAQDVSYIYTPSDNWMKYKVNDITDIIGDATTNINMFGDSEKDTMSWEIMKYVFDAEVNYNSNKYVQKVANKTTGTWRADYWEGPRHHSYQNVLTAFEVLQSAFWRYNYNWAYWVQLMVVKGEYNSDSIPVHDKEYIEGKNPVVMMNFKEFVIRSDETIKEKYKNEKWMLQRNIYLNKGMYRPFYFGFLLRSSITPQDDKEIDGYPGNIVFRNNMARRVDTYGKYMKYKDEDIPQKMYPQHPNYVACFIPNKEEDKALDGIIPELAVKSVKRYTRIHGYNKSKKFYSPDYTRNKPTKETNDYRRTLFWEADAKVDDDGCITFEFHNNSKENTLHIEAMGMKNNSYFIINN